MYIIWILYLIYFVYWAIKRNVFKRTKIYEFKKMNFIIIHKPWKIIKNNMTIILLVFISFSLSCSNRQEKFNKERWNSEEDRGFYEYRNQMLDDLINNHQLKGKTIKELNELFGYIQYYDTLNDKISFEVLQKWKGIDPSYTKYLVLKLDKNKKVKSIYIDEYKR